MTFLEYCGYMMVGLTGGFAGMFVGHVMMMNRLRRIKVVFEDEADK